jgi:hypothetical protein
MQSKPTDFRVNRMPLAHPRAWTAHHDSTDDVLVLELDDAVTPRGCALDLIIWSGGGWARTYATWRVRATRQTLWSVEATDA